MKLIVNKISKKIIVGNLVRFGLKFGPFLTCFLAKNRQFCDFQNRKDLKLLQNWAPDISYVISFSDISTPWPTFWPFLIFRAEIIEKSKNRSKSPIVRPKSKIFWISSSCLRGVLWPKFGRFSRFCYDRHLLSGTKRGC